MKKILAVLLCVLMLLGMSPAFSPPAQMVVDAKVHTPTNGYVGVQLVWYVTDVVGVGPYRYAFDVYRNGELLNMQDYQSDSYRYYTPKKTGSYRVKVYIRDLGSVQAPTLTFFSDSTPVEEKPVNKITSIEAISGTALRISWNRMIGATRYELWRSTTKLGTYRLVKSLTGLTSSYANTYLKPGTKYFYKVRYRTGGVWSSFSPPVVGVPLAKSAITTITAGKDRVTLAWSKVTGASGYEVRMSTSANGTYEKVRTNAGTTMLVTRLLPGKAYFFKVRPYQRSGTISYYGPLSGYRSIRTLK